MSSSFPESQELPDPKAHYSLASGLQERVSRSYGLALVLVISEFSRKNAIALEALRSWAHANFQRDPAFLHTVETVSVSSTHNSILDSFCYSLFAPPQTILESGAKSVLKHQIAAFHSTKEYESFRTDYFDSFGLDHESAGMLARYQSERAMKAVEVLIACDYWIVAALIGTALHFRCPYPDPIVALAALSGFLLVRSFSVLHSTFLGSERCFGACFFNRVCTCRAVSAQTDRDKFQRGSEAQPSSARADQTGISRLHLGRRSVWLQFKCLPGCTQAICRRRIQSHS